MLQRTEHCCNLSAPKRFPCTAKLFDGSDSLMMICRAFWVYQRSISGIAILRQRHDRCLKENENTSDISKCYVISFTAPKGYLDSFIKRVSLQYVSPSGESGGACAQLML